MMQEEAAVVRVPVEALGAWLEALLADVGFEPHNAGPVAATMLACERDRVRSHGLLRLKAFMHSVRIGWADGKARPRLVGEHPGLLVVDGQNGFAQTALAHARDRLVDMARQQGVAALAIRNAHHFAALWPDIEPLAEAGLVALAMVNAKARMAAWGGGRPVTGTNAMAFACPRRRHPPLIFDQSTSIMSQGDVLLAAAAGREVPEGIGVDAAGRPTRDPKAILDGGALLPFGGHKGASLAVMVEILAAALTGSAFAFEDASPSKSATTSRSGQFILAIDPGRANPEFLTRIEVLVAALRAAGAKRLPGERRYAARRQSLAEGVAIPRAEIVALAAMAPHIAAPWPSTR